jgi:hypothetical protein
MWEHPIYSINAGGETGRQEENGCNMYYRSRKGHVDKDGDRQRELEREKKRDCETSRIFTTHVRHCVLFLR